MAIDFRYPSVNLNQQAQLPSGGFGPPNLATMFQTGISALADPLVAKMKEEQSRAEAAKIAAEGLANLNRIYSQQQQPGAPIGTSGPLRRKRGPKVTVAADVKPAIGLTM